MEEDLEKLEKRHMYITSREFHQWLAFGSAIVGCTSCTDAHVADKLMLHVLLRFEFKEKCKN